LPEARRRSGWPLQENATMANFLEDAKKLIEERQTDRLLAFRVGKASAITAANEISDELTLIRALLQEVLQELRGDNRSTTAKP
jgi:hypothetical protein